MAYWGGFGGGFRGGFQGRGGSQFQKPENALKRAEELIEIGKKEDALNALNDGLRTFRRQWQPVMEQLVLKHLELCVELRNVRMAKDGVHAYRSICQQTNVASLETVIKQYRTMSEEKAFAAKDAAKKLAEEMDMDTEQSPDAILLGSVQADVRRQGERDLHAWFRYLWETYKNILDILKNNQKLEDLYHETARIAFTFLAENNCPQLFKRLCEMLRYHYQNLCKPPPNQTGPNFVNPSAPETVMKMLETRFEQLTQASKLQLWREAFATADDIHALMSKRKPLPRMQAKYYDALQKIFWHSGDYLFHALAMLRYYVLCKQNKRNFPREEEEEMASELVLATIVVPFDSEAPRLMESDMTLAEKHKRLARLLGAGGVPTKASLKQELVAKGVVKMACKSAQNLYELLEGGVNPLTIGEEAMPILDEIRTYSYAPMGGEQQLPLAKFDEPLKRSIFLVILQQLSQVYSTMSVESFTEITKILPWEEGEKMAVAASKAGILQLRIDYEGGQRAQDGQHVSAMMFGSEDFSAAAARQSLMKIGQTLTQLETQLFKAEHEKAEQQVRAKLYDGMKLRFQDEESEIKHRLHVIEDRKQVREREEQLLEEEEQLRLKQLEEKEADAERLRQEEEKKRRDAEREERQRKEREIDRNQQFIDQIKERAGKKADAIKVGTKTLKDLGKEDLGQIDIQTIEKARDEQARKERSLIIQARKAEAKRVDHLARAYREEEVKKFPEMKAQKKADQEELKKELREKEVKKRRKEHEIKAEAKVLLTPFVAAHKAWFQEVIEERKEQQKQAQAQANKRAKQNMQRKIEDKIARARRQMEKHYREEEEKEERRRKIEQQQEEARQRRIQEEQEEEERELRRQQREEEQKRREEQRRLDREREDEERERRGGRDDRDDDRDRRDDRFGRGGRDDRDSFGPRGGRDDRDSFGPRGGRDDDRGRFGPRGGRDDRDDDRDADRGPWRRTEPLRRDDRDDRDRRDDRRRDDRDDDRGGADDDWRGGMGRRDPPRRDDRDDRGPRRDARGDDDDNWRGGGNRQPARPAPSRRDDADSDPRFASLRSGGGGGERPRFGQRRDGDRPPPRRDDGDDDRFANLRSGGGGDRPVFRPKPRDDPPRDDRDGGWRSALKSKDSGGDERPKAPWAARRTEDKGDSGGDWRSQLKK